MSNFTLILHPQIQILFPAEFVIASYQASIMSFANNKHIWKGERYFTPTNGNAVYKNEAFSLKGLIIEPQTIRGDKMSDLRRIAFAISREYKTIVFYKHGTFEAVYDHRETITNN